jgi:hypothetical protein
MATATTLTGDALSAVPTAAPANRESARSSAPGAFHSQVALGFYAIALSLMDGLHMALREPAVRPPVIWLHLLLGLVVYPLFIRVAVVLTRQFLVVDDDGPNHHGAMPRGMPWTQWSCTGS